jgi:type I restriction enzyme S subunit
MRDGWSEVAIQDVAQQVRRTVSVEAGGRYPLLGVRWYGNGPFLREIGVGGRIKATKLYKVKAGDFIYNRLFAWKGSFGVIDEALSEKFVSGEFPTFVTDHQRLLPEYLNLLMCQSSTWTQIERESTGSTATSRNRWKESRFLEWPILLPPRLVQRRILNLIGAIDEQLDATDEVARRARQSVHVANSELIDWTQSLHPLGEVAIIESKLVDPTLDEYRNMPHIGVDRIVSSEGTLLPLLSAEQDGVTSGKHLFDSRDVIYSKIRPELRKAAFPASIGLCSADAYPLRPCSELMPEYLLDVLLSDSFTQQSVARSGRTKMPKINRQELFAIEIPVPALEEQREVVDFIGMLRDVGTAAHTSHEALLELKYALLASLLSGHREIPDSYDVLLEGCS